MGLPIRQILNLCGVLMVAVILPPRKGNPMTFQRLLQCKKKKSDNLIHETHYVYMALGPVSRMSRKLFGPEKPFVKFQPAYSVKLVFSYVSLLDMHVISRQKPFLVGQSISHTCSCTELETVYKPQGASKYKNTKKRTGNDWHHHKVQGNIGRLACVCINRDLT